MRYEGKSIEDAVAAAAAALHRPEQEVHYRVVRDEKSFWGGRLVEIDVEGPPQAESPEPAAASAASIEDDLTEPGPGPQPPRPAVLDRPSQPAAMDDAAFAAVEAILTELLSAAGFFVEIRRRPGPEMLFELIGDDVEPLLANSGEGLNGLEVLTGRIASKQLGQPVYARLDAEGFRKHQRETLQELALRSAEEAKRTRRPQLLPPLSPAERRLVHLALAEDPEVETQSEGDGFMKRVAVRPKAS
jgi:spoIIIJ-associated protein